MQKVKISQKDFDDLYEIDKGITEETVDNGDVIMPDKQDTTPELLTEEEKDLEDQYLDGYTEEEDGN